MPSFGTAMNCMDGRVQQPVIDYLKKRFQVEYVDMITEPGINKLIAEAATLEQLPSLVNKINISVEIHKSRIITVVGHYDCAGNPAPVEKQYEHLRQAVHRLKEKYPHLMIIPLWVNENWEVQEID